MKKTTRKHNRIHHFHIIPNLVLMLFVIICVVPFIYVISISLTDEAAILQNGYQILPIHFSVEAYKVLGQDMSMLVRAYGITIFVTVVGTTFSLLFGSQFAYVISCKSFVWKKQLSMYLFFIMLFNGGLVPTYILITKYLNLKDNLLALILPLMVNAWNIFLLRTFIQSIPESLIEAAKIDGASQYKIFFQIILPLSKSGLATICIFTMLAYWNDWYYNMLYITDSKLINLQYMLYQTMSKAQFANSARAAGTAFNIDLPEESLRMANCVLAVAPILIIFPFFQKYFTKGITVGAVKG